MYFKIEKGTELFDKLTKFFDRVKDANTKAMEMAKELGGTGDILQPSMYCAGGIDAIFFENGNPDPKMWVQDGMFLDAYMPRQKNKAVIKKLESLPKIEPKEIGIILGFTPQKRKISNGFEFIRNPDVKRLSGLFIVEIEMWMNYLPLPEMQEILESEYFALMAKEE